MSEDLGLDRGCAGVRERVNPRDPRWVCGKGQSWSDPREFGVVFFLGFLQAIKRSGEQLLCMWSVLNSRLPGSPRAAGPSGAGSDKSPEGGGGICPVILNPNVSDGRKRRGALGETSENNKRSSSPCPSCLSTPFSLSPAGIPDFFTRSRCFFFLFYFF